MFQGKIIVDASTKADLDFKEQMMSFKTPPSLVN
jgi:hypothetical protein